MDRLVIIAVIAAGLYVLSFWLHPMTACRKCKGTSRHYGSVHRKKFRFCHKCGGSGRKPRLGARVLVRMGLMKNPAATGSIGWVRRNRSGGR